MAFEGHKLRSEGRPHARALALSELSSFMASAALLALVPARQQALGRSVCFPLTVAGAHRCRLSHSQHAALGPIEVRVGSLHAAIRQQQPTLPWSAPSDSVTLSAASYGRLDNLAAPATTASTLSMHGRPVVLYESSLSAVSAAA